VLPNFVLNGGEQLRFLRDPLRAREEQGIDLSGVDRLTLVVNSKEKPLHLFVVEIDAKSFSEFWKNCGKLRRYLFLSHAIEIGFGVDDT
jgi:hypothetical protein